LQLFFLFLRETLSEFQEGVDIPMITNSSFDWLSGTQLDLNGQLSLSKNNQLSLNEIDSLFQMIDITCLNVECRQIQPICSLKF